MASDNDNLDHNIMVGFVDLYETKNHDGYLAAILVTDSQGVPKEFRCTHPVKPTVLQKPLYGDTLEPHIGVELCGIPLVHSVQNKPSLIIVRKEFLSGIRKGCDIAVIFLRPAGEPINITESDSSGSRLQRDEVKSPTGKFQPIVLISHADFEDDARKVRGKVEKLFANFNLLEPFERMTKSVELLTEQDQRFQ